MNTRCAKVTNARSVGEVERYLPYGWRAVQCDGFVLIYGTDRQGWTLDGYIIPRLASAFIVAREINAPDG